MKKVICILMMVIIVAIANIAMADRNPIDYEYHEVINMVEDWAVSQKMYDKYNWNLENEVYYAMGVVSETDFKELTGKDFSIEAMRDTYLNCKDYGQEWDITKCDIKTVGFHEGYNVYMMNMASNNTPIGTKIYDDYGVDYYEISILFMVGR